MYQEGKRIISHHKRHVVLVWLLFVLAVLVGGGVFIAKYFVKANTTLGTAPPAVVGKVDAGTGASKQFDEGNFTVSLPSDWVFVGHQTKPYNTYSWHNTKENPGVQQLQIYLDTIPTTLGVNRVLPLQANGDQLVPTTVSDNCADFTGNKVPGSVRTPAKWAGIDFLCDLGNYERDVVGTSASGSVNSVKVSGPTAGAHNIFFAYTDNGATPNFIILTNAVQSFRLK